MLHPGGDGELVRQVLGHDPVRDVGCLPSFEAEDQVAVAPTVSEQGGCPVGGATGSRQQVRAA